MPDHSPLTAALWPALSVSLLGLSLAGCLTVNDIPTTKGDHPSGESTDGGKKGGESRPDGGDGEPQSDGSALHPDAGDGGTKPTACFDRGTYTINGVSYRGMRQTCDGDLVCVEGKCVPLAPCEAGETHECSFNVPAQRGLVANVVAIDGDYIYWLEKGTMDARDNYNYDGALARAKVGEWSREELVSGLDFYDEARRAYDYAVSFAVGTGHALWQPWSSTSSFYVALSAQPATVREVPKTILRDVCWSDQYIYSIQGTSLKRQAWDGSGEVTLCSSLSSAGGIAGCVADETGVFVNYGSINDEHFDATEPFKRTHLSSRQQIFTSAAGRVWGVLADSWIGAATYDPSGDLKWTSIAGPSGGTVFVSDLFVIWLRANSLSTATRSQRFIGRTRTGGQGDQEVIAELPEQPYGAAMSASSLLWWNYQTPQQLHYAPVPPPAN